MIFKHLERNRSISLLNVTSSSFRWMKGQWKNWGVRVLIKVFVLIRTQSKDAGLKRGCEIDWITLWYYWRHKWFLHLWIGSRQYCSYAIKRWLKKNNKTSIFSGIWSFIRTEYFSWSMSISRKEETEQVIVFIYLFIIVF